MRQGGLKNLSSEDHQFVTSLASHVMPNGDPREGFFFPSLTLMTDSYVVFTFCLPEYLRIVSQHKFIKKFEQNYYNSTEN